MKKILKFLLSIVDEKAVIEVLIEVLKAKADKTENKIDDQLVALLENQKARLEKLASDAKAKATK